MLQVIVIRDRLHSVLKQLSHFHTLNKSSIKIILNNSPITYSKIIAEYPMLKQYRMLFVHWILQSTYQFYE